MQFYLMSKCDPYIVIFFNLYVLHEALATPLIFAL